MSIWDIKSISSASKCFNCEGSGESIQFLFVESAVHSNLVVLGVLADVSGWILTPCPYCRPHDYNRAKGYAS